MEAGILHQGLPLRQLLCPRLRHQLRKLNPDFRIHSPIDQNAVDAHRIKVGVKTKALISLNPHDLHRNLFINQPGAFLFDILLRKVH